MHAPTSFLLVVAQFSGLLLALAGPFTPARPVLQGPVSPWFELVVGVAGIGLAAFAGWHNRPSNFSIFPEVKSNARLISSGPYRFIRHPMYTALILIAAAAVAYRGDCVNVAGLGLMVLALIGKTTREERAMAAEFPEFEDYRKHTTRFIPYLF